MDQELSGFTAADTFLISYCLTCVYYLCASALADYFRAYCYCNNKQQVISSKTNFIAMCSNM